MDILKRIDQAQQFCKFYADGAYSIETEKWNHHVTPELIEDIRQNIESLQLKLMHQQTAQAKPYTFLWEADGSCEAVKGHVSVSQNTGPAHGWKITPLYAAPVDIAALTKERDALMAQLEKIEAKFETACNLALRVDAKNVNLKAAGKLALDALVAESRTTESNMTLARILTAISALKKVGVQ